jgi:hypothetical protein
VADVSGDERCEHLSPEKHAATCDGTGQPGAVGNGSGRHHRVRATWHMDRCPGCGLIHRGRYDGVAARTSPYLTANRLPVHTRRQRRADVTLVVVLAGLALLVVGPCLGWFLS